MIYKKKCLKVILIFSGFESCPQHVFVSGSMRGYLRKKGKDDSSWKVRLFVLSADNNSLSYYIKDQVCNLNH